MRRPRNYVELPLAAGARVALPERVHRHLQQVLRLGAGAEIVLFNGQDGRDWKARLVRVERRGTEAEVLEAGEVEAPPPLKISLALGISRGERMDFALQKAVELGACAFQPLLTERTQVKLSGSRMEKRLRHWRGVIIAACEQSGRRRLPSLAAPLTLNRWLQQERPTTLLLDPRAAQGLPEQNPGPELCFLVGPEGGLSPAERELAYRQDCRGIRLGPRILRAETAPLAALAAAQTLWGDLR